MNNLFNNTDKKFWIKIVLLILVSASGWILFIASSGERTTDSDPTSDAGVEEVTTYLTDTAVDESVSDTSSEPL